MARTNSEQFTQSEVDTAVKFFEKHNIPFDGSEHGVFNQEFVARYFLELYRQDITDQTLQLAFPQLQPHLRVYTRDEQLLNETLSKLSPNEQFEYRNWSLSGLKNTTRNNALVLAGTKQRGLEVTRQNLSYVAATHLAHQLEWEPVKQPRKTVSANDGHGFLGDKADMVKMTDAQGRVTGWRNKTAQEQLRDRRQAEQAEATKNQQQDNLSKTDLRFQELIAELLRYGNHARQQESRKLYDQCVQARYSLQKTWSTLNQVVDGWKVDALTTIANPRAGGW